MFSQRVVVGLVALITAGPCLAIPSGACMGDARPELAPPEARAIATAIAINDAKIKSLEWEQEVAFQNGGRRDLLEEGEHGFDEWRWYARLRWGHCEEPGGPMTYEGAEYTSVDDTTLTRHTELGGGMVRPPGLERYLWRSPETLLGRWLDTSGRRSLGELLLNADRLEVFDPAEEDGLVHLRAWTRLNLAYVVLDVAADPAHDFRVVEVTVADALLRTIHERRRVLEFTHIDGVWIPTAGVETVYANSMTEQESAAMSAEMKRLGLRRETMDPRDPEVQRKCAEMVASVFGEKGITSEPLGVGDMELRVRRIISVNRPIDDRKFEIQYDPAATIRDGYRDMVMSGDGADLRPNNPDPAEPPGSPDSPELN